ncbi:hypothetical protein CDAR_315841 [Caerostris darwini]|uniref:Uncharacterized protein n=1 Tax=Caerostris darwini TaxID=1538125 RepID=A0AAV4UW75_9ARAC|nr:hypothetical protein CDAR_315841 [Caerostris darwini]
MSASGLALDLETVADENLSSSIPPSRRRNHEIPDKNFSCHPDERKWSGVRASNPYLMSIRVVRFNRLWEKDLLVSTRSSRTMLPDFLLSIFKCTMP